MKLLVRHQTSYHYANPATRVAMRLKLMPVDSPGQMVREWQVSVNDQPVNGFARNGHGELEAIWICHERMEEAVIVAEGLVETAETHGVTGLLPHAVDPLYYLRDTPLTRPSDAIRALAQGTAAVGEEEGRLAQLHALSNAVADAVVYRAGVTSADTSAADALSQGAGVCQDHAQIFIAAARALDIPARYVSGYLLADEGHVLHETHGWAEALVEGLGWVGFDASNRVCVTERYIRIASGLDAYDAAPIRGSVVAAGEIRIDADVRIAQAEDGEEQRQLQRQQQQQRQTAAPSRP